MKNFYNVLTILLMITLLSSCERPTEVSTDDDGIPPAVPTGLEVYTATDGEVIIDWTRNPEKDLNGYNIYRKVNNSDFEKISFVTDDFYQDDSLNYNDIYYYKITATDLSGKESNFTDTVIARPINRYNPLTPQYLAINAQNWEGKKLIFLQWQQGQESDIAGFNIYRSTSESFSADSSTLIGFSGSLNYSDNAVQELYKKFFYKIRAVDKGGLLSKESYVVEDEIYGISPIVLPGDNVITDYFSDFKIVALDVPATYKIIVQTNEFFGEIWSNGITSSVTNDTLSISFTASYLEANKKYYWRVVTYSGSSEPNSISQLYSFTLKQQ